MSAPGLEKAKSESEASPRGTTLVDSFGRKVNYLRISVTDRCNFRCVYCMPENGYDWMPRKDVLSFEELVRVTRLFVTQGISRIRLTGGEPTVRKGIVDLVERIAGIAGVDDLSMTTNGFKLDELAEPLLAAGLDRFNVSLDSLKPDVFSAMTRGGDLKRVLAGISKVQSFGLTHPLKINAVVVGGLNDQEAPEIVRFFWDQNVIVRFIEYMPFTDVDGWRAGAYRPLSEVQAQLTEAFGLMREIDNSVKGNGPADYWRVPGASIRVGFIHPVSQHFCAACNRVRLTADGELRPCLGHVGAVQLRDALRASSDDSGVLALIQQALHTKPERHLFGEDPTQAKGVMTSIGG